MLHLSVCLSVCLCVRGPLAPLVGRAFCVHAPIFLTQNAEGFNQLGDMLIWTSQSRTQLHYLAGIQPPVGL